MAEDLNVCIIGAGNLAWHLAPALDNIGFAVREVYSRNPESAKQLVKRLYQAKVVESLDLSDSNSSIFFITVADSAIEEVATELILPENSIGVHSSGAQPLGLLEYLGIDDIGVFYPLQTFSKGVELDFSNIPIFLEAENAQTYKVLESMASRLSKTVNRLDTLDRRVLHLSAVYSCNFSNHLVSIAEEILEEKGLDIEYLHPLILETIRKAVKNGARKSQTGPALRKDEAVISQHLQLLSQKESLAEIYQVITKSIMEFHNKGQ